MKAFPRARASLGVGLEAIPGCAVRATRLYFSRMYMPPGGGERCCLVQVSIVLGVLFVSSFGAAFLAARLFGRAQPLTEEQRARLELDGILAELSPADLKGVTRISRELVLRQRRQG